MKIGLLDAMGYGNLGDAATQDAVIASIRTRRPQARIVGFSLVPDNTVKRHGIACYPITRHSQGNASQSQKASGPRNVKSAVKSACRRVPVLHALAKAAADIVREGMFLARSYRVLRNLDALIMSGGGQLDDLWGGAWAHPYNLFKFAVLAKLAGRKLYFLNVGAEPLEYRLSRFFAKSAVQLADYVSFRDDYSQAVVQNLGVTRETCVRPDCAYALDVSEYRNGSSVGSATATVGINVMGFCDPRVWPRKEQPVYEAYLEKMTKFCLWLVERGHSLRLFSTSLGIDKRAIADLKGRLLQRCILGDCNGGAFQSSGEPVKEVLCGVVQEVLAEIARCDFVLTAKYHGVIFSHLLRKPVIALSYQRKTEVAMKAIGLGDFCASIEHFESDWLIGAFRSLVRSCEAIKSQEATATAAYAETLRRQFDKLF